MDENKPTLFSALLAAAVHIFVLPALFWGLMIAPGIFALPSGIVFIWLTVRWSNRRDDSRYAKLPPDSP